jgi:hypothetical protein
MTTEPEPIDDSYPDSWKTADILRREEASNTTADREAWLATLSPSELALTLRRVRGDR